MEMKYPIYNSEGIQVGISECPEMANFMTEFYIENIEKPKWTKEHDKIVARYLKNKDKQKGLVIVPRS